MTTIESPKPITKPASASTIPHLQICLIEDDDLACMAAQGILAQTSRPCDIHIARDVAEALVLLSKLPFDIIISDIGLPDGTGFDIAMAVKQDPSHVNYRTPFVALTAHSDDEKREKAKQAGFLAVYNKPLRVDDADKIFDDFVPKKDEVKPVSDVVDLAVSMKITGGNIDVICKMLHTLVDSFAIEKPLFFQAFYDNDFTQARQLFHKFRGGLSYVRVPTLEHRAKTLHEEVKALEQGKGTLSDLQPKLNELCDAVDAITAWLEKHKA